MRIRCIALFVALVSLGEAQPFKHPGILHTEADFERIRRNVEAGEQPYLSGWHALANNPLSDSNWKPRPVEVVIRGGRGDNVARMYIDIARAYQCALRWKIGGSTTHGDTARDILNAWSGTLTTVSGNADRYLASGLFGYQWANAAEIMRDYPGFEVERMRLMLTNVFYKPLVERFLYGNESGGDHNDAHIENYFANWDLCNMAAAAAIGIFCDRRDIYQRAIAYYKYGAGNGSIYHAAPYLHGGLAQWQESGRDQAHAQLGIGLMAVFCEMAWNQGDDMYGFADNRFLKAAEYTALYNNGGHVPFSAYRWYRGQGNGSLQTHSVVSDAERGEVRPIWEMIYHHYANRRSLAVPNVAARAQSQRPEGGPIPGGHGSTFDQTGFGTLLFTRPGGSGEGATPHNGPLDDGIYMIVARNSGKAMEARETAAGIEVSQQPVDGGRAPQRWSLTHTGGGEYRITSIPNGNVLGIPTASHDDGARLSISEDRGESNQRFALFPTDGGYFRLIPGHSGKAVDVSNGSTQDGATIRQWKWLRNHAQQWKLVAVRTTPSKPMVPSATE